METCGNYIPIDYSDVDEEQQQLFPQQIQCFKCPITRRNRQQRCQHFLNQEDTSSSSSSSSSSDTETSSSSSDSEMDISKKLKRTNIGMKKQQRKWFTIVNLQGLRPQDVTVKVDRQRHLLIVKLKTGISKYQQLGFQQNQGNIVQVVPLPQNIRLEKLQVKVTPTGDLIVCAPYRFQGQHTTGMFPQHQQQRFPSWVPIQVTRKGKNIFGTQQEQNLYNPRSFSQRHQQNFYPTENIYGCSQQQKYWRGLETQNTGMFPQTLPTQIIRDEETGKLTMLLKVNTVGFLPQEVRVRMDKTKRVLIVEAGKRGLKKQQMELQLPWKTQQQGGVRVNYLRREFIVPQQVDVKHITVRVLPNGILIVKLPIVNRFASQDFLGQNTLGKKYRQHTQNTPLKGLKVSIWA